MSLRLAEGLQVDAELLALLVQVTALEAEGAGDVGHVKIMPANLAKQDFTFEGFGALHKRSLPRFCVAPGTRGFAAGQRRAHFFGADRVFRSEQH